MLKRFPARLRSAALLTGCALILSGCAATVSPPSEPIRTYIKPAQAYATWAQVLQRFVNEKGQVDFARLSQQRGELDRFVAWVYDVGPGTQPDYFPEREDVLAYHVNAYNALAMYNVLETGIPEHLNLLDRYNFFVRRKLRVGGVDMSLKAYEDNVIRTMGDPRIHFAINCMAVSCPRLPQVPFLPDTLDGQLNDAAREFFNREKHVKVEPDKEIVRYSAILDFFPDDFLRYAPSLTAYVNRFRRKPIPESYTVRFLDYDWTINAQNNTNSSNPPPLHIRPDHNRY